MHDNYGRRLWPLCVTLSGHVGGGVVSAVNDAGSAGVQRNTSGGCSIRAQHNDQVCSCSDPITQKGDQTVTYWYAWNVLGWHSALFTV
jgi:hypothetical protein